MSTNVLLNQHPTPNVEESNSSTASNLLMCNMSISHPNPKVKNRQAEKVLKTTYKAEDKAVVVHNNLIREDFVKPLTTQMSAIRRFFADNTLALGKSKGVRGGVMTIIPARNYWRVVDFWNKSSADWDLITQDFISRWENEIRPLSLASIGDLESSLTASQRKWYSFPSEEIARRIYYVFEKDLMAGPGAVSCMKGIDKEIQEGLEVELEAKHSKLAEEANTELKNRLKEQVQKLYDKMKEYDPSDKKKMHDSIIGNLKDVAELLPDMCIAEGSERDEIIELADEAKTICNWDVEMLRGEGGESCRKEVAKEASKLLDNIQGGQTADEITNMMKF